MRGLAIDRRQFIPDPKGMTGWTGYLMTALSGASLPAGCPGTGCLSLAPGSYDGRLANVAQWGEWHTGPVAFAISGYLSADDAGAALAGGIRWGNSYSNDPPNGKAGGIAVYGVPALPVWMPFSVGVPLTVAPTDIPYFTPNLQNGGATGNVYVALVRMTPLY